MSSSISLPFRVICVGLKSLLALPTSPVGVARWSLRVLSCRGGSKIAQLPLVSQSLICTGVWLNLMWKLLKQFMGIGLISGIKLVNVNLVCRTALLPCLRVFLLALLVLGNHLPPNVSEPSLLMGKEVTGRMAGFRVKLLCCLLKSSKCLLSLANVGC